MSWLSKYSVVVFAMGAGCSDDGVPADGTDSATGVSATATSFGTGSEAGPGSVSDTISSTDPSTTSTSAEATSGVTSPGTDGSSGTVDSTGIDSSETGTTTMTCTDETECTLINDCCNCLAIHAGDVEPPQCDVKCDQPLCDAAGVVGDVTCEFGTCQLPEVNCDQQQVFCESLPPDCDEGFLPGVNDLGCWTNTCVPVDACNMVPSCEACPDGQVCIALVAKGPAGFICSPVAPDCPAVPDCACLPDVCPEPFDGCFDGPQGISCECLVC